MGKIKRIIQELKAFFLADRMILHYARQRTAKDKVNLHAYHSEWEADAAELPCNLGDYLAEVIVRSLLKERGIDPDTRIGEKKHLYALGSILQFGYQNATVWGSGFAYEPGGTRARLQTRRKLDIRAVRGPKTRRSLLRLGFACPPVYGDPGVLMPRIYQPEDREIKEEILLIPHYSMEARTREQHPDKPILSMHSTDYKAVIDRICSAKKVIASSLHGIILAEVYGVPAVWYQDRAERFNYKYEDWYESTGRFGVKPAKSIEGAIAMEAVLPDPEAIRKLQEDLLASFPADLWSV